MTIRADEDEVSKLAAPIQRDWADYAGDLLSILIPVSVELLAGAESAHTCDAVLDEAQLYAFLHSRFKACYDKHILPVSAFLAHVDPVAKGSGRAQKSIPTVEQMYGVVRPSPEENKEEKFTL